MADIDLPVWSIPPNWSTPVTERLEWLTDVLQSRSMSEQRRAIRLTPRRFFEFKINPVGRVRSYFDQFAHRIADERMLLPIWHDKGKLTEASPEGDVSLEFDAEFMEFTDGGLALLWADPFNYEVVEIDMASSSGLQLTSGVQADWPKGSTIYPLRRAYLDPEISLSNLTSRVGESTLSFMLDTDNPYDPGVEALPVYDGYPVTMLEPNRMDSLNQQFMRVMEELDNRIGRVRRVDENPRSFQTQFYNWKARGREEHHKLRQTLYRLNGRQKGVWMPSFNHDIVLAGNVGPSQGFLDIERIGYSTLGGAIAGRDRLMIRDNDGEQKIVRVNSSANQTATVERLALSAPAGFTADKERPGSFLSLVRLDQDIIEITHHTDSMGICEVSAAFRSFNGARVAPTILIQPPVEAVMGDVPCGHSSMVPCAPQYFNGWDYEISLRRTFTRWDSANGLYIWPPPGGGGGNAIGGAIGDYDTYFGPDSPNNQGNQRWGARRINMGDPDQPPPFGFEGVGNWNATIDVGITNYFGTPPDQLNSTSIFLYMRHWTEPFPGRLVWSELNYYGNGDFNPGFFNDIDWRDFR